MVSELCLSRNELLCYAIIYGFCQDGQSFFSGTSAYIAEWLNIDKRNALDVLKRLCDKGLLIKKERNIGGIKLCDYKTSPVVMKHHRGGDETSPGGGDETSPHIYNIDNNKDNNMAEKKEEQKMIYIDEGMFYIDDTMPQYRQVIDDLDPPIRDGICERVYNWLIQNRRCDMVSEQFIIERIVQFRPWPKKSEKDKKSA